MAEITVEIADKELICEYDFKITAHGAPEPGFGAEFEVRLRFPNQAADHPDLEIPAWLKDLLTTYLKTTT